MMFPIDHDLHTHTQLSLCSGDPAQTAERLLTHAKENNYTVQCVTDHFWDELVPGPSGFYAPQDLAHVKESLPLPQDDRVKMVFGCETEFVGGKKFALHPSHYDEFDFIVIPPNHFHMKGFTRPECYDTEEKIADLFTERLEEISLLDLPFHKVGIAHMVCSLIFPEGDECKVYRSVEEKRFRTVMNRFAQLGAGIEINAGCFGKMTGGNEADYLRLYRLAKEEGCKFYLASDAHHPKELDLIQKYAARVITALGLTEEHLFRIKE